LLQSPETLVLAFHETIIDFGANKTVDVKPLMATIMKGGNELVCYE
jgi:hypothetical protein